MSQQGQIPFIPLSITLTGTLIVQWYVWSYSSYGRKKNAALVIGKKFPILPVETLAGDITSTNIFIGKKALIVFFRGTWCPLCMGQMREILANADRLKKANVQVRFISNQPIKKSQQLKIDSDFPEHFDIMYDKDLRAAKTLSIQDVGGTPTGMLGFPSDTTMATTIALNAEGIILFGDETENYRVRPHPDAFMHLFES